MKKLTEHATGQRKGSLSLHRAGARQVLEEFQRAHQGLVTARTYAAMVEDLLRGVLAGDVTARAEAAALLGVDTDGEEG